MLVVLVCTASRVSLSLSCISWRSLARPTVVAASGRARDAQEHAAWPATNGVESEGEAMLPSRGAFGPEAVGPGLVAAELQQSMRVLAGAGPASLVPFRAAVSASQSARILARLPTTSPTRPASQERWGAGSPSTTIITPLRLKVRERSTLSVLCANCRRICQ